jgi:hypothetical protein
MAPYRKRDRSPDSTLLKEFPCHDGAPDRVRDGRMWLSFKLILKVSLKRLLRLANVVEQTRKEAKIVASELCAKSRSEISNGHEMLSQ